MSIGPSREPVRDEALPTLAADASASGRSALPGEQKRNRIAAPGIDGVTDVVVPDVSALIKNKFGRALIAYQALKGNVVDAVTQAVLCAVFQRLCKGGQRLRVEFSNGKDWTNCADGEAELSIHFKTRRAELRTLFYFYEGFFEKYIDQEIDLVGEHPVALICRMGQAGELSPEQQRRSARIYSRNPLMVVRKLVQERLQSNKTKAIAKQNADFHYAIHPKLFEEMLGETVGYSEGYWPAGTSNLNQAKHNNYEYICRKLDLKPGDRVIEVGSGWGFMPIYMVKNYAVTATVYNPVKRQNDYMRERFERHGVGDKIRIVEGDHRDILNEPKSSHDKFVSIGVHEHHGMRIDRYDEWWASVAHVLRPGGVGIVSAASFMEYVATNFLTLKYIFPGGHIPSLPHEMASMRRAGLTLTEIENLWPHYRRTMAEWRTRFGERWLDIRKSDPDFFDERFRRSWTLYLDGTLEAFASSLDLSHIVFVQGRDSTNYPQTPPGRSVADFRTGNQSVECYR